MPGFKPHFEIEQMEIPNLKLFLFIRFDGPIDLSTAPASKPIENLCPASARVGSNGALG